MNVWIESSAPSIDSDIRGELEVLASGPFGTFGVVCTQPKTGKECLEYNVFWIHDGKWFQLHRL